MVSITPVLPASKPSLMADIVNQSHSTLYGRVSMGFERLSLETSAGRALCTATVH